MKHWLKISLSVIFLSFHTLSYANPNAQKINALAHAFMQQGDIPGLSIAVIDKDQTQIFNYGYANELKKIPTTDHTIYSIASITKTFTATLSGVAAAEGKLNLNAPITQYLPELNNNHNLNTMTISMLLGHVASLPFNFTPAPQNEAEALKALTQFTPPYPPGTQYQYSNASIGLVGYALQNIYGQSYEQLITKKINQPLGMTATYLNVPTDQQQYLALGHDEHGSVAYDPRLNTWFAAASLKSTISDLAKYLNAQMNPHTFNNPILAQGLILVHQNKYCFANQVSCEQLGWQAHAMSELNVAQNDALYSVDAQNKINFATQKIINNPNFPKKYFVDKTGTGYGVTSYIAYIPSERLGVVILFNKTILTHTEMHNQGVKLGRDILKSLE